MSSSVDLLFRIKAESSQAQTEVRKFRQTVGAELAAVNRHTGGTAQGTSQLANAFRALSSATVIVDGPLGGVASRVRAIGTEMTALSGVFPPVIAMLVAAGGVIAGAGLGLFHLAKRTAEFGDSLDDAREKTSLSVETLSALKFAGQEANLTIEAMTGGLVRFVRNLEEAATGNKKLAGEFKQLGVSAFHDSDLALQQFLAGFAKLKTDQERTLAATEIFGARFGATLIETFGKVGGDLEKFKARLRELGLLMTDEEARAADEFTKALNDLGIMLAGVGRTIGQETIPAFIAGFKAIEAALEANKTDWKSWGEFAAKTILTVEALLGGLANVAAKADWTNFLPFYGPFKGGKDFVQGLTETADKVTKAYNLLTNPPVGADASASFGQKRFSIPPSGGKGKSKTPQDEIYKAALAASKDASAKEVEEQRNLGELLQQAYELNLATLEEYHSDRLEIITLNFNAEIDAINREQAALDAARLRGRIKLEEAAKKDEELTLRTTKAKNKLKEETNQNAIDKQRALDKADIDLNRQLADIRIAQREDEFATIEDLLNHQVFTEAEAIDERMRVEKEAYEDRILLIDLELGKLTTSAARKIELDNEKIASEQLYTNSVNRGTQDRNDALARHAAQYVKLDTEAANTLRERGLQERRVQLERLVSTTSLNARLIEEFRKLRNDEAQEHHNRIMDEIGAQQSQAHAIDKGGKHKLEIEQRYNALRKQENDRFNEERKQNDKEAERDKAREGAAGGFLSGLQTGQLTELAGGVQSFADVATVAFSAVGVAVNGLAKGIGSMVQNWVLMGSQADISMKKLVATVLAGVAMQAATLAVFELALAIAALTPFGAIIYGSAAQHFQAAALFGSIALGAALIGRAAAGNDFQNKSATASAPGGGGGSGTSTSSTEPKPLDIDRRRFVGNSQAPAPIVFQPQITIRPQITVVGQATEGFRYMVEKAVVDSVRENGPMRKVQNGEAV